MNWSRIKKRFYWFPEVFLILILIQYWTMSVLPVNWIAISLISALVIQLIFKNKQMGQILGSLLSILSCYLFLALFSDIVNAEKFDRSVLIMTVLGSLYLGAVLFASVLLLLKNRERQELSDPG